jgi:hypothetical protein
MKGSNGRSRTPSGGERFSYIFPKDLPRMSPMREFEFTIDLKPWTELIARMPYQMSTP